MDLPLFSLNATPINLLPFLFGLNLYNLGSKELRRQAELELENAPIVSSERKPAVARLKIDSFITSNDV